MLNAVEVHNLGVTFGSTEILRGVDLVASSGVVALVGANGSGKSTLLRAMATLITPTYGQLLIYGNDVRQNPQDVRHSIGFLPQQPAFPNRFTLYEAVSYAAWLQKVPSSKAESAIERAISRTGLTPFTKQRLKHLSGGMRRRAHLAQVLVHNPPVLLLDEPTVGMDAEHRLEFRTVVKELAQDSTVIMSTHLSEDIEHLADHIVVLDAGLVAWSGTVHQLTDSIIPNPGESLIETALGRFRGSQ